MNNESFHTDDFEENITEPSYKYSILNIKNMLILLGALTMTLLGYLALCNLDSKVPTNNNILNLNAKTNSTDPVGQTESEDDYDFKTNPIINGHEFIIFPRDAKIIMVNPLNLEAKVLYENVYRRNIENLQVAAKWNRVYYNCSWSANKIYTLEIDPESLKKGPQVISFVEDNGNGFCLVQNGLFFVENKELKLAYFAFENDSIPIPSAYHFNTELKFVKPKLYFVSKDNLTLFYGYDDFYRKDVYMKTLSDPGVGTKIFTVSENGGFVQCPRNPNLMIAIGILSTNHNRNDIVIFNLINKTEFKSIPTNCKIENVLKLEFSNDGKILYLFHARKIDFDYKNIELVKIDYEKLMKLANNQESLGEDKFEFILSKNVIKFETAKSKQTEPEDNESFDSKLDDLNFLDCDFQYSE